MGTDIHSTAGSVGILTEVCSDGKEEHPRWQQQPVHA